MPEFVRLHRDGQPERIVGLWSSTMRDAALVVLPITAFCVAFSADLIGLIYGGKYAASSSVFRVYTLALIPRMAVFATLLHAAGRSGLILAIACVSFAVNVLANVLLVPRFGPVGAAASCVGTLAANALMLLLATSSLLDVGIGKLVPWRRTALIALLSAMSVVAARAITQWIPVLGWRLLSGSAAFCTLMIACLIAVEGRDRVLGFFRSVTKCWVAQ
jgi:O-antigen/teichoic acid export membrane protein